MKIRFLNILCLLLITLIPTIVFADASGRGSSDYTGGPSQNRNCTNCHSDFPVNSGPGKFQLLGLPTSYVANSTYTLTLRITQTGQSRWGFQLKALLPTTSAGTIVVTDATHTSLTYGSTTGFLNQTSTGTYAGTTIGQWSFNWKAPSVANNTVRFYASGNAANNSGDELGDYIYTLSSAVPPSLVPVELSGFTAEITGIKPR